MVPLFFFFNPIFLNTKFILLFYYLFLKNCHVIKNDLTLIKLLTNRWLACWLKGKLGDVVTTNNWNLNWPWDDGLFMSAKTSTSLNKTISYSMSLNLVYFVRYYLGFLNFILNLLILDQFHTICIAQIVAFGRFCETLSHPFEYPFF